MNLSGILEKAEIKNSTPRAKVPFLKGESLFFREITRIIATDVREGGPKKHCFAPHRALGVVMKSGYLVD
ncbi:hypothetical protein CHS0354_021854 [Potamilus streckersoni]|uniref:Uncharacterized protein n=1 Tax=Potamilus streckersoni TaxID=2493646 RepID=A0AAE0TFD4_9BIVA|nr:hypothetical protein CHS0354_021854 [Potamilus streckersoni]